MFAKIKPSIFIDALTFELTTPASGGGRKPVRGILRDETGIVCSTIEKEIASEKEQFTWTGLNDLPYGTYTLELSQGNDEMKLRLVKRV